MTAEPSSDPGDVRLQASRFTSLWTQCAQRVYSYILTMLPSAADAEEVFQEVAVTLWEKFETFDPGTNFRAWACRVAYYKVLQFMQQRQRGPSLLGNEFLDVVDRVAMQHAQELDRRYRALADCMAQLPPRDHDLVMRRYAAGASTKTVAKDVGRSIDAIYKAMQRIHASLLDCINARVAAED